MDNKGLYSYFIHKKVVSLFSLRDSMLEVIIDVKVKLVL